MLGLGNKAILSRNLRRLMSDRDVTPKEVSKAICIPYTTVLSWVNAENYPRIDKIEMLAKYFGVMKSDLIEEKLMEDAEQEKPATDDGLSDNVRKLIDFARTVPEDKAEMILRVMQSIVESDR